MRRAEVVVEVGVRGRHGERGEQLDLRLHVLDDRLDDEVAVDEVVDVGGHLDPARVAVVELAGERLRLLLRSPCRGVAAGEQADLAPRRSPRRRGRTRSPRCRRSPAARIRGRSRRGSFQTPRGERAARRLVDWPVNQWDMLSSPDLQADRAVSADVEPEGKMENGSFQGREVVIVEAARTPIGRGHEEKGYYKDVHASNLLAKTYSDVIDRAGIDPAIVEDAIAGCVQQFGEQGINIARNAWLEAGLPIETPATTVDRPVRLRPAGRQLRCRARRLRRRRHRHRRRRRAHGPHLVRRQHVGDAGARDGVLAPADGALQPRPAGISAEMIADKWEIPAPSSTRSASAPPARRPRDRGGPLRARDHPVPGQRRHLRDRPGDPPRHQPREARRSSSPRSRRTARSRPATPPRCPTAPPRCC